MDGGGCDDKGLEVGAVDDVGDGFGERDEDADERSAFGGVVVVQRGGLGGRDVGVQLGKRAFHGDPRWAGAELCALNAQNADGIPHPGLGTLLRNHPAILHGFLHHPQHGPLVELGVSGHLAEKMGYLVLRTSLSPKELCCGRAS